MTNNLNFKPKDIEKLYKDQASKYTEFANESFSWRFIEKPLLNSVLASFNLKKTKILDAGCGTGRTLKYLTKKGFSPKNIVGIDISEDMVELASKTNPDIAVQKSDLAKFSSPNTFDLILSIHVLHYLNEKDFLKALKNFNRLLVKGGTLCFVLAHPVRTTRHNLSEYFKRDWIVDFTPWGTKSPLFLRPVSDIINATIKAGFEITSVQEPNIPTKVNKIDPVNYLRYSGAPPRIAVIAKKKASY